MKRELIYHATMSPFRELLQIGTITEEDFRVIDTIMCRRYAPLFSGRIAPEALDIKETQS